MVASRLNPRSTAYEPDLYSLEKVEPARRQSVEKEFFGKLIDDQAARALEAVCTRRAAGRTPEHRVMLSHFLMSLRARHPDAVKRAREDGPAELRPHLALDPEQLLTVCDTAPTRRSCVPCAEMCSWIASTEQSVDRRPSTFTAPTRRMERLSRSFEAPPERRACPNLCAGLGLCTRLGLNRVQISRKPQLLDRLLSRFRTSAIQGGRASQTGSKAVFRCVDVPYF